MRGYYFCLEFKDSFIKELERVGFKGREVGEGLDLGLGRCLICLILVCIGFLGCFCVFLGLVFLIINEVFEEMILRFFLVL